MIENAKFDKDEEDIEEEENVVEEMNETTWDETIEDSVRIMAFRIEIPLVTVEMRRKYGDDTDYKVNVACCLRGRP